MSDSRDRNVSDAHTEQPSLKGRKAVITGGTTGLALFFFHQFCVA